MSEKKKILIVIPVYNEGKNIRKVIRNVQHAIDVRSADILIINDGSTDKTADYLKKLNTVIIRHHPENQGYGRSLISGFDYAVKNKYKYIITMDCDCQHSPDEINKFTGIIIKKKYDIVSGSRYLNFNPDLQNKVPGDRLKINRKITDKINKLTRYNLTDSFCGFKAYKTASLKKLKLDEPGYGLPIQLWLRAAAKNLKIIEIPVKLIYLDWTKNFHNNFKSVYERYKYYLEIIKREVKNNEYSGCIGSS